MNLKTASEFLTWLHVALWLSLARDVPVTLCYSCDSYDNVMRVTLSQSQSESRWQHPANRPGICQLCHANDIHFKQKYRLFVIYLGWKHFDYDVLKLFCRFIIHKLSHKNIVYERDCKKSFSLKFGVNWRFWQQKQNVNLSQTWSQAHLTKHNLIVNRPSFPNYG